MEVFEFLRAMHGAAGGAAGGAGWSLGRVCGWRACIYVPPEAGWLINNASDINRKNVCFSFLTVLLKHT